MMRQRNKRGEDVSIDNLKERAENALEGRGIKRKKSFKKQVIFRKKKKRDPDIFD